jgi:hypothetical protein
VQVRFSGEASVFLRTQLPNSPKLLQKAAQFHERIMTQLIAALDRL